MPAKSKTVQWRIIRFDKRGASPDMRIQAKLPLFGESLDRRAGKRRREACRIFVEPVRESSHWEGVTRTRNQVSLRGC